jgi:Xaa-Pro dipeptidase
MDDTAAVDFPRFSAAEYARRSAVTRADMAEDDLAALIVFGVRGRGAVSVPYLCNFLPSATAHLLFPIDGEPTLFVQLWNHLPLARRLAAIEDVRWGGINSAASLAAELGARGLGGARLGVVGDLPWADAEVLRRELPNLRLVNWNRRFLRNRLVKSDEELQWMRRAAELTDRGMAAIERELRPGLDERELPRIVESTYLGEWGTNEIHYMTTTSMHRPEICVPAQYSAARTIQPGDVLITEVSASYWGYPAQILRPYAVAEEPAELYRRLYDVCRRAYSAVASVLRAGATAQQVVDAVEFIEEEGFSIYDDLLHGYGGGYLAPVLRTRATLHESVPDFTFEANATVVIQPNVITLDERAGVQLGNLVRITETGCESLHRYPLGFPVTGRASSP